MKILVEASVRVYILRFAIVPVASVEYAGLSADIKST